MREMKNSHIPFCDNIPEKWNEMPNKYLFSEHSSKVGSEHSKYQLLSLTKNGVKEKDVNASGGKVPDSYENYQTVTSGDMIFCLFDLAKPNHHIIAYNESVCQYFPDKLFVLRRFVRIPPHKPIKMPEIVPVMESTIK